ncbi:MAG: NADH-quinone oxidoreductase subunit C [Candidatus Omnitrophica bacterium]|nr:NADH-quinone oxidoreductase subunit C [Candidatus Omnitrophota bacterium]
MGQEEKIREGFLAAFGYLQDKITIQRSRRIFVTVDIEKFAEVFDFAVKKLGFSVLCVITGLDEGDRLTFIYHLDDGSGVMLNLKTGVSKERPVIKTVTEYFPSAEVYERELVDLLGAKVEGLLPGYRYPLPDGWPSGEYPLRKDWIPENKNG